MLWDRRTVGSILGSLNLPPPLHRRAFIASLLGCAGSVALRGAVPPKHRPLKVLSQVMTRRYTNTEITVRGLIYTIAFDSGVFYPETDTYVRGPVDVLLPFVDDSGQLLRAVGGMKGNLLFAGQTDLIPVEQVTIDTGGAGNILEGAIQRDDGGQSPVPNVVLRYRVVSWV